MRVKRKKKFGDTKKQKEKKKTEIVHIFMLVLSQSLDDSWKKQVCVFFWRNSLSMKLENFYHCYSSLNHLLLSTTMHLFPPLLTFLFAFWFALPTQRDVFRKHNNLLSNAQSQSQDLSMLAWRHHVALRF
jgi:hypothetical protein